MFNSFTSTMLTVHSFFHIKNNFMRELTVIYFCRYSSKKYVEYSKLSAVCLPFFFLNPSPLFSFSDIFPWYLRLKYIVIYPNLFSHLYVVPLQLFSDTNPFFSQISINSFEISGYFKLSWCWYHSLPLCSLSLNSLH